MSTKPCRVYGMAYNLMQLHSTLCSGGLSFARSLALTWGVCAYSPYVLVIPFFGDLLCAAAFALGCCRICLCVLLLGYPGFSLKVAILGRLLGNTWPPLFRALIRRLYSLGLYRSDVWAWLALLCWWGVCSTPCGAVHCITIDVSLGISYAGNHSE